MQDNWRDAYTTLVARVLGILRFAHCSSFGAVSKITAEEELDVRMISRCICVSGIQLGCYLKEIHI
jgi:hypothetical protein